MQDKLSPTMEHYLGIIYMLQKDHGHAHVKTIAEKSENKMPSVTEALRKLKWAGFINYTRYSCVTLTNKGVRHARRLYDDHLTLYGFFRNILGVREDIAEKDACLIEHVINRQTLQKLREFVHTLE
jgi:DtxR family Mn-dependent transcriptional regulator